MFEVNQDLKVKIERLTDIYWSATDTGLVTFDSTIKIEKMVFIIDDFYQNPDEVRNLAKQSKNYFNISTVCKSTSQTPPQSYHPQDPVHHHPPRPHLPL